MSEQPVQKEGLKREMGNDGVERLLLIGLLLDGFVIRGQNAGQRSLGLHLASCRVDLARRGTAWHGLTRYHGISESGVCGRVMFVLNRASGSSPLPVQNTEAATTRNNEGGQHLFT